MSGERNTGDEIPKMRTEGPSTHLTLEPIGYIQTPFQDRYVAPRQPGLDGSAEGVITLTKGKNFEQALTDLDGFERIWLLYWFDRNPNWKPMVLPPRSGATKRGVFATRSPHRPNPIGLSVVELIEVTGLTIRVANVDLLDGTPILDIKPYLPYADAHPDSRIGWITEKEVGGAEYSVEWSDLAREQSDWLLREFKIDLITLANSVLAQDPSEHSYKRITLLENECFELAIKSWRVLFRIEGEVGSRPKVRIYSVSSGYAGETLLAGSSESLHDSEAHRAFHANWVG